MKNKYKIGDPVQKVYINCGAEQLSGVHYIKQGEGQRVVLAQEKYPYSHFTYATLSELRKSRFTKKQKADMMQYREEDMRANNWKEKPDNY